MPIIDLQDPHDPRLAKWRTVSDAALLRQEGLFIAEGRTIVQRVLDDPRFVVASLLVNHAALAALEPGLARARPDVDVCLCPTSAFEALTGFNFHRGCLALVRRPQLPEWRQAVSDSSLVVALDGIADPDNVGSVFRSAAAFGAGAVLLSDTCCDPLYRKAVRTSMGAALRVPFATLSAWPEVLDGLKSEGYAVVAMTLRQGTMTLEEFVTARPGRVVLLLGSEANGLTDSVERLASHRVRIPISSKVDSLNVSVAAAVALSRLSVLAR